MSAYFVRLACEQRAELVQTLMSVIAQKFAFIGRKIERLRTLSRCSLGICRSRSGICLLCILSRALLPLFTA